MIPVSVVIIAKNEAHIIEQTLMAAQTLTDDVIVVDSGSTDGTEDIVKRNNARFIEVNWLGFGPTKNKGIDAAYNDWILSIDADEIPDQELMKNISYLDLSNDSVVYNIRFKTFLGNKVIRFGEWGNDSHIRLFNRTKVRWNNNQVHERLQLTADTLIKNIEGYIHHYTSKDLGEYVNKMTKYALLNAEGNFVKGKQSGWLQRNFSHHFSFISNYFFRLGFFDGIQGYWIAKITAYYTFVKYARLYELNQTKK
jgi:glycosyltransferase involved in cell wall biosynthesis